MKLPPFIKVTDLTSPHGPDETVYVNTSLISKLVLRVDEHNTPNDVFLTVDGITYVVVDPLQVLDALFPE